MYADQSPGRNKIFHLVVVDVLSRLLFVRRLANLRADAMIAAFRSLLESVGRLPGLLGTDLGSEFISRRLSDFLSGHGVKQAFLRDPRTKACLAERRIRDIRSVTAKYAASVGTTMVDEATLQRLVEQINNRPHPALPNGLAPSDVQPRHERDICDFRYGRRWRALKHSRFQFLLHEKVRLNMTSEQFAKSHLPFNWSTVVYRITDRHPSRPPTYSITPELAGAEPLLGKMYAEELMRVEVDTPSQLLYPVQRVLRRRIERATGREQSLVQYRVPLRYVEWVYSELVEKEAIITPPADL